VIATTAARAPRRPSYARLVVTQVRYQTMLLIRSPAGAFFALVMPVMILAALEFLHGQQSIAGVSAAQFFTAAMIAFAVMNAGYITTITGTVIARDDGILKRLHGTPLPPSAYFAGRIGAAALTTALAVVAVMLVGVAFYRIHIDAPLIGAMVLTVIVGVLCFSSVGLAATVLVGSTDVALPMAYGSLLPLCFVSDVFLPTGGVPTWLSTATSVFPVKHLADALESIFVATPGSAVLSGTDLWMMFGWAAGALAITVLFFQWEPRPAGPGIRGRLGKVLKRLHVRLASVRRAFHQS
jgi:ABC-2 type transport system permease protein